MANELDMSVSISVDLTDSTPFEGIPGSGISIPTGPYKVLTSAFGKYNDNSVRWDTNIVGGEFDGTSKWVFTGIEMERKEAKRNIHTTLLSHGYTEEEIKSNPQVELNNDLFTGRGAYIYNKARNPDDKDSKDQTSFITPAAYKKLMEESGVAAAPAGGLGKPGLGTKAPAKTGLGAGTNGTVTTPKTGGLRAALAAKA